MTGDPPSHVGADHVAVAVVPDAVTVGAAGATGGRSAPHLRARYSSISRRSASVSARLNSSTSATSRSAVAVVEPCRPIVTARIVWVPVIVELPVGAPFTQTPRVLADRFALTTYVVPAVERGLPIDAWNWPTLSSRTSRVLSQVMLNSGLSAGRRSISRDGVPDRRRVTTYIVRSPVIPYGFDADVPPSIWLPLNVITGRPFMVCVVAAGRSPADGAAAGLPRPLRSAQVCTMFDTRPVSAAPSRTPSPSMSAASSHIRTSVPPSTAGRALNDTVAAGLEPWVLVATALAVYVTPLTRPVSVHVRPGWAAVQVRVACPAAVAVTVTDVGVAPVGAPQVIDAVVSPGVAARFAGALGAPLTISVRVATIDAPVASMPRNDTVAVPSDVGVPVISPVVDIDSPAGRPVARYVYGAVPPVTAGAVAV